MGAGQVDVFPAKPSVNDIVSGGLVLLASTAQTAFLTIPAGRTWVGSVTAIAASLATTASTQSAKVVTNGTGVTPAAGTIVAVSLSSRDTAPGVTTQKVFVTAPAANSVTLELVNSTATTFGGAACASGTLLP
jgi:hypothetical protein